MDVIICTDGNIRFIYNDDLASLLEAGEATVKRASHVEPHPDGGGWIADMSPIANIDIVLGANGSWFLGASGWALIKPFSTRAEALAAEVAWLQKHRGL